MARAFNSDFRLMAVVPERFVAVDVRFVRGMTAPGDPIFAEARIRNLSKLRLPLGDTGLLRPAVSLTVTVKSHDTRQFTDLPLIVLPTSRYLDAGKNVVQRVRLDVGSFGRFLAQNPMQASTLTLTAIVDPRPISGAPASAARTIRVKPALAIRRDIFEPFRREKAEYWPIMYQRALGLIVRDMKHKSLAKRMRAARRTGMLLCLARRIERKEARPPRPLDRKITKPVLIRMLQEVLKDPSEAVRAEAVHALLGAPLDTSLVHPIQTLMEDPSPLVRIRLAELFGVSQAYNRKTLVNHLRKDDDDFVRMMADGFQK